MRFLSSAARRGRRLASQESYNQLVNSKESRRRPTTRRQQSRDDELQKGIININVLISCGISKHQEPFRTPKESSVALIVFLILFVFSDRDLSWLLFEIRLRSFLSSDRDAILLRFCLWRRGGGLMAGNWIRRHIVLWEPCLPVMSLSIIHVISN